MGALSRCSHCQVAVEPGLQWCPKCGAVVSWQTPAAENPSSTGAFLVVRSPGGPERTTPLSSPVVRVGRAGSCDVVVPDPRVSRIHATFELRDGAYHLADAHSSGGTFLEGKPVHGPVRVAPGSTIRLGRNEEDAITLEFRQAPAPPPAGLAPPSPDAPPASPAPPPLPPPPLPPAE